ncbi:cell death regulator Aven [Parambassis ranga]|uniref:Cell death regulator Aven n=1 Tax=Parambassis ranga TaxID=210632 RepID=A0A6P7HW86_9TELE|nr:cell death regulator Aven [Parambassis ranga]
MAESMDGRLSRGREGGGKRGGRGGNDSGSSVGEYRGRGRGGHHRGRGKRDHYRGRGRGGGAHGADFIQRDQDEVDRFEEEDDRMGDFSRRKLESNWHRYEESEREEPEDDTPTQRGTDYHVLLESAGDSFTQFRFSEEKEWEMDSLAASQMPAVFVDLPALAQTLQQVPLHQRLNLEAELLQVSTPAELPAVTLAPKQEVPKDTKFPPLSSVFKNLSTNQKVPVTAHTVSRVSAAAEPLEDEGDEELDKLLNLQKPVSAGADEDEDRAVPENVCEEVKEVAPEVIQNVRMEEVKDITPPKSPPVKQKMTEEDLEDWLDSMIS